jgi:hypothetical protein
MSTGARFTKWGLGLFIFGVFLSLGPILHYLVGSQYPTGEMLHTTSRCGGAARGRSPLPWCRSVASAWSRSA